VGILSFLKWFDVDVLGFQIELCCRYFDLFLAWRLFGLLFKKLGDFFKLSGHPGYKEERGGNLQGFFIST
jgi:hypothetical protein